MHPTIDEQLHGAQRLLDLVEVDPGLSAESAELLTNVRRLLVQVGRSWALLLPFYVKDNAAMAELLDRRAALAPGLSVAVAEVSGLDVHAAAARNAELRTALTGLITGLPATPDGRAAQTEIAQYLGGRIAADPS